MLQWYQIKSIRFFYVAKRAAVITKSTEAQCTFSKAVEAYMVP